MWRITVILVLLSSGLAGCNFSAGPWSGNNERIIPAAREARSARPVKIPAVDSDTPVPPSADPNTQSRTSPSEKAVEVPPQPVDVQQKTDAPDITELEQAALDEDTHLLESFANPDTQPIDTETAVAVDRTGEIDRASAERSLQKRAGRFQEIARRPLTDGSQVHLVNAVFDYLLSDSAKEQTLILLIKNPLFCHDARTAILDRLDGFVNQGSRNRIKALLP
jgi:hypothetical protein